MQRVLAVTLNCMRSRLGAWVFVLELTKKMQPWSLHDGRKGLGDDWKTIEKPEICEL